MSKTIYAGLVQRAAVALRAGLVDAAAVPFSRLHGHCAALAHGVGMDWKHADDKGLEIATDAWKSVHGVLPSY